jgi:hypothetical protein
MIKFAINYSTQAARLVAQNDIDIDRFKCPDWPDLVMEASRLRPVAVHFTLQAGSGNINKTDWGAVERLLIQTGTDYVNLHLAPECSDYPGIPVETSAEEHQLVIERMIGDVRSVVRQFGAESVIVENVPYRGLEGSVLRPGVWVAAGYLSHPHLSAPPGNGRTRLYGSFAGRPPARTALHRIALLGR